MTPADIQKRLDAIRSAVEDKDNELAHIQEDRLWADVLRHIAEHCTDDVCRLLAKRALDSESVGFSRWFS